jgi:hypothetical protein
VELHEFDLENRIEGEADSMPLSGGSSIAALFQRKLALMGTCCLSPWPGSSARWWANTRAGDHVLVLGKVIDGKLLDSKAEPHDLSRNRRHGGRLCAVSRRFRRLNGAAAPVHSGCSARHRLGVRAGVFGRGWDSATVLG